ncbi:KH domain-containing protein [Patescibacteria group bacterium]|nr:KH domain-containing protein [Patescibacteria group bacterium]MBU1895977.1 KH domain-containing protein [Patescibacteria group bacterium]
MEEDQKFIEMVVKAIVNNPDDVKTERTVDERGVLITLDINQADMGYVIGRQGQTARSLRTLLKIVGAKNNARVNLKINEPEGGRGPRPSTAPGAYSAPSAPAVSMDDVDTSAVDDLNI